MAGARRPAADEAGRGSGSPRTPARPRRRSWSFSACRWSSARTATASRSAASTPRRSPPTPRGPRRSRSSSPSSCWSTGRSTAGRRTGRRCTSCASGSRSRPASRSRSRSRPERRPRRTAPGRPRKRSPRGSARPGTPACRSWPRSTKRPRRTRRSTSGPSEMPSGAERTELIRAAVAEVQRQNSAWTRGQLVLELYRQMPALPADADPVRVPQRAGRRGAVRAEPRTASVDPDRPGARRHRRDPARPSARTARRSTGRPARRGSSPAEHLDLEQHLVDVARAAGPAARHAEAGGRGAGRDGPGPSQREAVTRAC